MSYTLARGETVSLNSLATKAHSPVIVKVESTRDAIKRNDLNAVHRAIKVFGVK